MAFEPNWLIQIPDQSNPNALRARQENVIAHMAHNKPRIDAGHIVMTGPMVASHSKSTGEPAVLKGSVMVWKADSEADIRAQLSEDPFAAGGVWDLDQATIVPFLCAMRKQL
ncbi:YCII-related domain-containing protein [Dothidotthia symphoricarpi CBS 119687]|uniref:YCII-related domain-containing protein n=1 Tax=Dothidotthia symphoricarpi CBS 119687 TaxID=1392245 RepID=A0A6A6AU59_9PLEO|nr:YCII-related domain-containing protein [Dothidotthia symphoricarpi CBS 119687]KAF2134743.1 YCII-related domain-containing protein [Dothidotthia symphoricarpi CBS 119687]